MLAYAPRPERRRFHPAALALIAAAHAVAITAVMSARMNMPDPFEPTITRIQPIPIEPDPEPAKPEPRASAQQRQSQRDTPKPIVDPVISTGPEIELPSAPDPGPVIASGSGTLPILDPPIIRTGPRFATPAHRLKPPYPEDKRRLDQEAVLKLRLSIDERGRVVSVEPVGHADPAFLDAARRHIIKAWRYQPAKDGDRAIASSTVITLQFKLD